MDIVSNFSITVLPFLISLISALALTPISIWMFKKMGWVIDPKKSPHPAHIHKEPVPKGGGMVVLISILITWGLLMKFDKHLWAIAIASLITVAVGLVDDVKGISPYLRLVINFFVAGIIVASGIGISFISNPLGGVIDLSAWKIGVDFLGHREIWVLADILAILWIPTLMNAINWSSGVDGQISGVMAVASMALGIISMSYSADIATWPVSVIAFSVSGAFAGLTVYHFYPQKIMPGYSSTSLAGLLLGVISILATAKVGALVVILGVPLIDFGYLIIKRISSGKSPVWGDKSHLHHQLMAIGWGKRRIAIFYWVATALLSVLAIWGESITKLYIVIGLMILMSLFWIWRYFQTSSKA